ncbi:LamG-like jellyroll fold domain-containing protein [Actinocorallia sp. B10E7]|uniref:LamG-like jellyroll fold domain-containing protein n=1 Tax=Actinocorallia sp. B10E7 TaxID=3153558 RepID=UPI00325C5F9C
MIGAGFLGGHWPGQSHYSTTDGTGYANFFNGTISDVALFDRTLTQQEITQLHGAATQSAGVLTSITTPEGRTQASVVYDTVTGTVTKVTDKHGGVWEISAPTMNGSSKVYQASVLGSAPASYYRFRDPGGSTNGANEVNSGPAIYSGTTLGGEGPFTDSTGAAFNGTSSYVQLPNSNQVQTSPGSIEMWFKMPSGNTAGGVLYSEQSDQLPGATTATGNRVPALYVGTDGKLRGKFWDTNGTANSTITNAAVNDGKWHHVVLAAKSDSQTLYLDGVEQNTINATLQTTQVNYVYVGAGMAGGTWPHAPTNTLGYFPGSIGEFAFYRSQLSKEAVAAHYAASKNAKGLALMKTVNVKDPGNKTTSYEYDVAGGYKLISTVDVDTTGYDVRGNKVSESSCQNQAANICSTKYYSYWPDATTEHLAPNPKNDVQLTERDGQSSGPTDDRYLTVNQYDDKGNQTEMVTAPVPGFPGGRFTKTSYTDGTTIAAADGGFAPAGLPYKVVQPSGATTLTSYFKNGDIASTTDAAGLVTNYTYDGLGRKLTETVVSSAYPAGLTTSYKYDYLGRVIEELSPPVLNRVTGAIHTSKSVTTHDLDGNVISQTVSDTTGGDASRTKSFVFDNRGLLTSATDALGNVETYEYDGYGNKTGVHDEMGDYTVHTYDANGKLLTTTLKDYTGNPNNPSQPQDLVMESRAYDPAGRLASVTDVEGVTTSYTYTDDDLVATVTKTATGQGPYVEKSTVYNAAGHVVEETINNGATKSTHAVDAVGRVTSTTVDPGGVGRITKVSYTPDDKIATTSSTDAGGWPITKSFTYDPMGRTTSESIASDDPGHPVGWWRLNQSSGTTVADASGTGYTAGISGNVTWADDAAVFPGTNGQQIATNGPVVDTSQTFPVSAWVKLSSIPNGNVTAVAQDGNRQSGFYLQYSQAQNKWALVRPNSDTDNAWGTDARGTSTPAAGTWTHLVGTFNAADGQMKLYVNGTQEGTATATTPWNATGPLTIGRGKWNGGAADAFPGSVSNVQVYNRLLSGTEVTNLHTKGRTSGTTASFTKATTRWKLDERGLATEMTDPNGNVTNFAYDEAGQLTTTVSPTVNVETGGGQPLPQRPTDQVGYNTFGEATEQQDANGNTITTAYDAEGRKVSETLPSYTAPGSSTPITSVSTWTYDDSGAVLTETDGAGNTTTYEYDQLGHKSKIIDAEDGVTTMVNSPDGEVLSLTTPEGVQTQKTYDLLDRPLTTTVLERHPSPTAVTTTYSYTASAQNPGGAFLASETAPGNLTTTYAYNKLGERTSVTDPSNGVTSTVYDQEGRAVKVTNPDGTARTVGYDVLDNPTTTRQFDVDGTVLTTVTATYDAAGRSLSTTDARGHTTTLTRDANGLITAQTEPVDTGASITISYGYDAENNRTRYTDGRGNNWIYGYNVWNLRESALEPATTAHTSTADRRTTIAYDAAKRAVTHTLPGGVSTTTSYDGLDRVIGQTGNGSEADTAERSFVYDGDGRMVEASTDGLSLSVPATEENFTYNDRGQLLTATGSAGNSSFIYDTGGRMTSATSAAGTVGYTYDNAGRLSTLSDPASGTTLTYGYDVRSQVTSIDYGTSKDRTFTYDRLHRLTDDTLKTSGGTTLASVAYGYDANGNLTSKNTTGVTGASNNTYTYDRANRLASWNNGTATTAYEYDASGNRTKVGSKTFTYDARDQLTSDGTTTYTYTARGTLLTRNGSGTANFTSDAFGQQVTSSSTGGTQTYQLDAIGRTLKATGPSGAVFSYSGLENDLASDGTSTYTRAPDGSLIASNAATGTAGAGVLAFTDQHDDVIASFTGTGTALTASATYDPLGNVTAGSAPLSLGYQSGWTDPTTGQVNMWSRWYSPETGQFQNKDTVETEAVPNSAAANPFAYVAGNPMIGTDEDGHCSWWNVACKAKQIVEAAKRKAKAEQEARARAEREARQRAVVAAAALREAIRQAAARARIQQELRVRAAIGRRILDLPADSKAKPKRITLAKPGLVRDVTKTATVVVKNAHKTNNKMVVGKRSSNAIMPKQGKEFAQCMATAKTMKKAGPTKASTICATVAEMAVSTVQAVRKAYGPCKTQEDDWKCVDNGTFQNGLQHATWMALITIHFGPKLPDGSAGIMRI